VKEFKVQKGNKTKVKKSSTKKN